MTTSFMPGRASRAAAIGGPVGPARLARSGRGVYPRQRPAARCQRCRRLTKLTGTVSDSDLKSESRLSSAVHPGAAPAAGPVATGFERAVGNAAMGPAIERLHASSTDPPSASGDSAFFRNPTSTVRSGAVSLE